MCDEYKKDYLITDIIDLKDKFGDNRGFIQPLCDLNMKSASLIYTKADQWKQIIIIKDWHFIYVIKMNLSITLENDTNEIEKIVTEGQLCYRSMIDHAMLYTKETEILVVSKNPRDQKTYGKIR